MPKAPESSALRIRAATQMSVESSMRQDHAPQGRRMSFIMSDNPFEMLTA